MSIKSTPRRWGLGPKVDPDFEARVERFAARSRAAKDEDAWVVGYIEFIGGKPIDSLHKLLEQIYRAPSAQDRGKPPPPKLVREIRFLTTEPASGIALPMASFMPGRGGKAALKKDETALESAKRRLAKAAGDKLDSAQRIGLTVVFDLEVIAGDLRPFYSDEPGIRERTRGRIWAEDDLQRVLFGEDVELRRFGVQKIGLSGTVRPQLADAQCLLQTPTAASPQDYGLLQTGRNTIVGIVDFGCDFAHPSFRTGARQSGSRILALWDQNDSVAGRPPVITVNGVDRDFGYGRVFERQDIQKALFDWLNAAPPAPADPYSLLGYDPHANHYTASAPGSAGGPDGAHGTFVMEVAAGGRRTVPATAAAAEQPCGVAPDADIVFVQARVRKQPGGRRELDLGDVLEAVDFVFQVAEREHRPCAVNLSLNTMSGPHDGDGYFDRTLATLLRTGTAGPQARGRSVVIAAGNLPDSSVQGLRWQHLTDDVAVGAPVTFDWRIPANDPTPNVVEIWYDATDAWLQVELRGDGKLFPAVLPGQTVILEDDGKWCGTVTGSMLQADAGAGLAPQAPPPQMVAGTPPPGRHLIRLELAEVAHTATFWQVTLAIAPPANNAAPSNSTVCFHAWLARDDNGPSGLGRPGQPPNPIQDRDRPCTIGTLSCGPDAIVVGGYSTALGSMGPWGLSGHGPSRLDVHFRPDLCAPAHYVALVRSGRGNGLPDTLAHVTGTSVAAPFVTGTIACVYEHKPDATLAEIRAALVSSALPLAGHPAPLAGHPAGWCADIGHGRLNPAGVLACFP